MEETKKEELSRLKERFEALMEEMSAARKKGKDTKIAEIQAMNIKPKIMMALVTFEDKDLGKIKEKIDLIEKEIRESAADNTVFIPSEDYDLKRIRARIEDTYEYIEKGNKTAALDLYKEINLMYKMLESEQKKKILQECVELNKRIKEIS